MSNLAIFTTTSTDSDHVGCDWFIEQDRVTSTMIDDYHTAEDRELSQRLDVNGTALLRSHVQEIATESEAPYQGIQARHLERIIHSIDTFFEHEIQSAYLTITKQQDRRRSVGLASRRNGS